MSNGEQRKSGKFRHALRQTNDISRRCLRYLPTRARLEGRSTLFTAPFASRLTDIKIQLLSVEEKVYYPRLSNLHAGSWPISKPRAERTSRFPLALLLRVFFCARVIHKRRRTTAWVQQSDFRGVFTYRRVGRLSVTNFYENAEVHARGDMSARTWSVKHDISAGILASSQLSVALDATSF